MPHHQGKYRVARRMEAQKNLLVAPQAGKVSVCQDLITSDLFMFEICDSLVVSGPSDTVIYSQWIDNMETYTPSGHFFKQKKLFTRCLRNSVTCT